MAEQPSSRTPLHIVVQDGRLRCSGREFPCAVGRAGIRSDKREGDGATPSGCFPLRTLLFRPDRQAGIVTSLPLLALHPADGWCDDADDPHYNQLIKLPFAARHEVLWRVDNLYDVMIVVGYNDSPIIPGRGSAIFIHNAGPDFGPTEGCVALAPIHLIELVGLVDENTVMDVIGPP